VLELQKNLLKFNFPEDNMDLAINETFIVTNHGNAQARFKWQVSGTGIFVPSPMEDIVEAGGSKTVKVTFTPPGPKPDDEALIMKIDDGVNLNVKCQGQVNESKCTFIEKALDFGNVPVGIKTKEEILHIKNQFRTPAIYHVIPGPEAEELSISPMKGKIPPDQKITLQVSFMSNVEKSFSTEITVLIRGGKPLKIPVKAQSIVPDVKIEEEMFDFGGVTFGDSKTLPLTIYNESNIEAKLILDLRELPEFEIILP
jgi:hypothetical protein